MHLSSGYTPRKAFYPVILQILVEMGGTGRSRDILDRVEQAMHKVLTPGDYEPRSDTHQEPRWHFEANWSRTEMRHIGLLKPNSESQHGIWAITDEGRSYLSSHKPRD